MASVVEICNMALSRIGNSQRIDSLTERSVQAEQCALFYEQTRDMVLRDRQWPFATKFVQLAAVTDNPSPVSAFCYSMPTDCLFARRIVDGIMEAPYVGAWANEYFSLPQRPGIPFRIIQGDSTRLIATSVSPAMLEYTARIEDPGLFDPMFVSALAWKLGVELAIPLSKDQSVATSCEQQYQMSLSAAFAQGMNEGLADLMPQSSFITGRY